VCVCTSFSLPSPSLPPLLSTLISCDCLRGSLSLSPSPKHLFFLAPPSPPPCPATKKQLQKFVCAAAPRLSCLSVSPSCLASRQSPFKIAASLVGEILSFHKSQFRFSRNRSRCIVPHRHPLQPSHFPSCSRSHPGGVWPAFELGVPMALQNQLEGL
jgi:hypothetical protein